VGGVSGLLTGRSQESIGDFTSSRRYLNRNFSRGPKGGLKGEQHGIGSAKDTDTVGGQRRGGGGLPRQLEYSAKKLSDDG